MLHLHSLDKYPFTCVLSILHGLLMRDKKLLIVIKFIGGFMARTFKSQLNFETLILLP